MTPSRRADRLARGLALLAAIGLASAAGGQDRERPRKQDKAGSQDADSDYGDLLGPSTTGYIDDAVIRTQVRIRSDAALDADRPDRAEFIYGKCDCFATNAGQDAASPGPAHDLDLYELELGLERALRPRFSLFVEIPFRSMELTKARGDTPIGNRGLGDARLGVKYALIARRDRFLTLQVRGYLPTGDASAGLGTDHASIEPALLHFGRLSSRWTVSSELRWWHPLSGSSDPATGASDPRCSVGRVVVVPEEPFCDVPSERPDPAVSNDGFAGDLLRLGVGVAYEGRGSPYSFSPILEVVGWYVLGGFSTPPLPGLGTLEETRDPLHFGFIEDATDDTIVNLKLGVRIASRRQGSVYLGYGAALTDDIWYQDIVRVEYRYSF